MVDISKKLSYRETIFIPLKIHPWLTVVLWVNMIIKIIVSPLEIIATANFIDAAIQKMTIFESLSWDKTLVWLICLLVIKLYKYLEEPLLRVINNQKKQSEWETIDYPAIKARASLKFEYIENSEIRDLIARVAYPADKLCNIESNLLGFVVFLGQIISTAIVLIISAPIPGIIIILSAVPMILVGKKSAAAQFKIKQDITKNERLIWSLHDYLKKREYVSERKLFSFSDFIEKKFKKEFLNSRKAVLWAEIKWDIKKSVLGLFMIIISAIVVFILLPRVLNNILSVGLYIALVQSIFNISENIAFNLSPILERITKDKIFLDEYNQYVNLTRVIGAIDPPATVSPKFHSLEFVHVSFKYPETQTIVLKDVSFKIEEGKRYSLVGINGSGKSTIIKLILKFYDNYTGEILLNGRSIRDWELVQIKAIVGIIFQDFVHYDISIANNISVGSGLTANEKEIDKAIQLSGLDETLNKFSGGKETLLGKIFENGQELSGGEWQKVAIARSIVSNCTLKIFDEPTSALDPLVERNIYNKIEQLSRDVTTIFISHRLSSCLHSDKIFLLKDGVILESGNHIELIKKDGVYREMFESQRKWYL